MATAVARAAAPQAEAAREGENSRKAEAAKGRKRAKITPIVAPLASSIGMPQISLKPLSLARSALLSGTRIQPSLMISQPGDAAEAEADRVASTIVSMPDPGPRPSNRTTATLHRSPLIVQRAPTANPTPANQADAETEAAVKKELSGGRPMAPDIQSFFGRRFNADFSGVRIHTDGRAENLSTRLGARAFTYGRHIFFNAGQYKPDSTEGATLVAHELTHTIQQSATIQRKEAATAAPRVTSRSAPQAQRGIISDALDWFADKANYIPGFRLFTIIIGLNPINMSKVERSGANILRALIEFIPGGGLIVDALNNHGIFEKGGKFIEDQFASLGMVGAAFRDALMEFVDSLGWRDIFRLGSVWERAKRIFTAPVTRLIDFGRGLVSGIATIVKDAILKPLGKWASKNIPKWDLLVGVFGKNPISDEGESPAAAIIGGFMELIGQKEVYENIKKGNALGKAWNWFKSTFGEALALVMSIPGEVMATIRSLTIFDIVTIVGAFGKILGAFGAFVGKFITWAGGKVLKLLEIILEVVAPDVIPYLKKAGSAFSTIIKNPIRFVQTLVRAGKQGFAQFASNFLSHLQRSLVGWLTGAMAGANIYIPTGFSVMEILKFVLSILGLTWQNIRAKLVRATNETTVVALETGFDIVRTLVTQGPAAAWEKIVETIGNLKQMAIDAIMDFVKSRVVEAAVTKLVSMLNPAGAFIQALIGIYNTVMFFVERIRQIAQVAAAFIDGIAAIAAGNVSPAANKVETTMGGLLTLVISFLARIAGLGRVADAVTNLINRIRAPIDRALDRVVEWIVGHARALGRVVMSGARRAVAAVTNWWRERRNIRLADGETHNLYWRGSAANAQLRLASVDKPVEQHLTEALADATLSSKHPAIQVALNHYRQHIAPLSGRQNPTAEQIRQGMDQFSQFAILLAAISNPTNDADYPPPNPQFGGPRNAFFGGVNIRTSGGGAASSAIMTPTWELLTNRNMTRSGQRWVRMHMISARYGGIDAMTNFIPAPSAVNTGGIVRGFERGVEETLEGTRAGRQRASGGSPFTSAQMNRNVIWLATRANSFYGASQEPDGTVIANTAPNVFAQSATFMVGTYLRTGTSWTRNTGPTMEVTVPIDPPDFAATYVPTINSVGATAIRTATGAGFLVARDIVAERGGTPAPSPHAGAAVFLSRMIAYRTRLGLPITPEYTAGLNAVTSAMTSTPPRMRWTR